MFNCRICGKEYETLEEAMVCEQNCYSDQKVKKAMQEEAKNDTKQISKETKNLIEHIKKHIDAYHEDVNIEGICFDPKSNSTLYRSDILRSLIDAFGF